ncbi:MAG: tautomerase family protein [Undibacterium umbellatum]|uniref:tautomerase family protein n=1 Tax=Undibacterium umbellatum TaxID=2762300 RepID=UPI003BB779FB
MPMSRVSLLKGKSPAYLQALSDALHQALVDAYGVPLKDRFQLIQQHEANELVFDRDYLSHQGKPRSDDFVLIQITAGRQRSSATKAAFYRKLIELLAKSPGLRAEDVMVIINTTAVEDWSFSSGLMYDGVARYE